MEKDCCYYEVNQQKRLLLVFREPKSNHLKTETYHIAYQTMQHQKKKSNYMEKIEFKSLMYLYRTPQQNKNCERKKVGDSQKQGFV
jgi:hypothetical protein